MSDGYRFAIGDWVKVTQPSDPAETGRVYAAFRVVGRRSDECPGGVQRSYSLRSMKKPDALVLSMHEFEIEPWIHEDDMNSFANDYRDSFKDLSSANLCIISAVIEKEMRRRADEAAAAASGGEAKGESDV